MFSLKQHAVQISNVNTRVERHGEERKLGIDISFATKVGSDQIDALSTGLRESLFRAPGSGDQISLLNANAMTAVRHPSMKPIQLTHKFPGYEMTIAPLDSEEDDGEFFVDVELKGFSVEPHEGGSCTVTFKAGATVKTEEAKAMLDALLAEDADLTLVPPKAQAQQQDLGADANETEDEGEGEGEDLSAAA